MRKENKSNNFIHYFYFFSLVSVSTRIVHALCIPLLVNKAQRIRVLRQNTSSLRRDSLMNTQRRLKRKKINCRINSLFLFSLHTKSIHYGWITDASWTILPMSLLPFLTLNVSVALLSMQGQNGFHQKYLNLCSKDEQMSYGFSN